MQHFILTCKNNLAQSSNYRVTVTLKTAIYGKKPGSREEEYMIIRHLLNPVLSHRTTSDFSERDGTKSLVARYYCGSYLPYFEGSDAFKDIK